jgi:hypothetical protein
VIVKRSISLQLFILHFGVPVEAEDELDHVDDEGKRVDGAIEKRQRPKTEMRQRPKSVRDRKPKCSTQNPPNVGPVKLPRKNEAVHIP